MVQKCPTLFDTIATLPCALASRIVASSPTVESHRKSNLKIFYICGPGVGHVNLHTVGSVVSRPSTGAATDGFIPSAYPCTNREIVHGSLA